MRRRAPLTLQHGSLTVYLHPLAPCPDLQSLVRSVPRDVPLVWFDSARQHPVTGRWSMVGFDPWLTLLASGDRIEVRTGAATHVRKEHPLQALRAILQRYHVPPLAQPHARGLGLMGWLSYDLNRWIERLPDPQPSWGSVPEMLWYAMRVVVLVDHLEQRGWLLSVADPHSPEPLARRNALEALERWRDILNQPPRHAPPAPVVRRVTEASVHATTSQPEFEQMVARALDYIRAGDIFQANVSQRVTGSWAGSPLQLYERLRQINPSPFSCWFSAGDLAVVSCSPERLVRIQGDRVDTRPIAGTRPRGLTPEDDAINSLELLLNEKERAEHIMLVDLARNDLGRVCRMGSVAVNELMTLEDYSHVIHIVSDVAGALRKDVDPVDVIRAVFPGGTITGCPKVRCMQILRELEPVARGLYTGSLGYIGFDGTMDLNIAIRTMVIQGASLSFHVGAGIVADSDPEREYHETLAKAQALMIALAGGSGLGAQSPQPTAPSPQRSFNGETC